jgi:hypothetical protein
MGLLTFQAVDMSSLFGANNSFTISGGRHPKNIKKIFASHQQVLRVESIVE